MRKEVFVEEPLEETVQDRNWVSDDSVDDRRDVCVCVWGGGWKGGGKDDAAMT